MANTRSSKLDKKMDEIKRKEEAGLLESKDNNRALNKFTNNKLAVLGAIIFSLILFGSVFAPFLSPYNPGSIDVLNKLEPPSLSHVFGTDQLGRDVFTRVLYGGRISILVGLGSALGAAFIGVLIGCYTGYKGGWIDKIFMRISETFMSFPRMILVLMLVSILGQSLMNLIIVFVLTGWGPVYRMVRSQMLSIREEEYVQALRAFGLNDFVISYKHMLPNAVAPILVNITLSTAMFILQETSLSFLGLGVPPNIPTWGNILNVAQDLSILKENWWIWLPVGLVISTFVLSINFIGDGLRDATDPSQQG